MDRKTVGQNNRWIGKHMDGKTGRTDLQEDSKWVKIFFFPAQFSFCLDFRGALIDSVTSLGKISPFRLLFTYQFSPKQPVSTHSLFEVSKMWRFGLLNYALM
jgi:hypothetical protein